MPGRVPTTAVTEAGDMPDEDLVRAEGVTVGASARRTGDPFAVGRLDQLAEHNQKGKPICVSGFVHASLASGRASLE